MVQLQGAEAEMALLWNRQAARSGESRELHTAALGACHVLFPRGVRDNMREVNKCLRTMPTWFREAVEDGIR